MTIEAVVLDFDGFELGRGEFDSRKAAKAYCQNAMTEEWAKSSETTHQNMRTNKAEVRVDGECVWDVFYARTNLGI